MSRLSLRSGFFHSIRNPIRMRNVDSPYPTHGGHPAQGTQNRAQSVGSRQGIPLKSQIVNMAAPTNTPGRESPHYYPASQRKTAHD
jgi:hypothetical protein